MRCIKCRSRRAALDGVTCRVCDVRHLAPERVVLVPVLDVPWRPDRRDEVQP